MGPELIRPDGRRRSRVIASAVFEIRRYAYDPYQPVGTFMDRMERVERGHSPLEDPEMPRELLGQIQQIAPLKASKPPATIRQTATY